MVRASPLGIVLAAGLGYSPPEGYREGVFSVLDSRVPLPGVCGVGLDVVIGAPVFADAQDVVSTRSGPVR